MVNVTLKRDEVAAILAALRYYQINGQHHCWNREDEIDRLATNDGDNRSLDSDGIDDLINRLVLLRKASL